jgi:hypothetical protein
MAPSRIVLLIEVRRLAKKNIKQMGIGIVKDTRIIKRYFGVVLFNRLFLGGRRGIIIVRRGEGVTIVVDDLLDALPSFALLLLL